MRLRASQEWNCPRLSAPKEIPHERQPEQRRRVSAPALGQNEARGHEHAGRGHRQPDPATMPERRDADAQRHHQPRGEIPGQRIGQGERGQRLAALQAVLELLAFAEPGGYQSPSARSIPSGFRS